jgi:hypothetical protein
MFTKIIRMLFRLTKNGYGFGHCDGDDGGSGHCT